LTLLASSKVAHLSHRVTHPWVTFSEGNACQEGIAKVRESLHLGR
jgi:hypothetical protein